jgi:hypothetical protein
MRLILHIGPPKTGSTAIQQALSHAAPALAAAGIHAPVGPEPEEWGPVLLYSRQGAELYPVQRLHFDGIEHARSWAAEWWRAFEADVDRARPEVTVLSSEHLANVVDVDGIVSRLRRRFSGIVALAYTRDPVALYLSGLGQAILGGAHRSELPGVRATPYGPVANLRRWEAALGPEGLCVRVFERAEGGDIAADAFAAFGRLSGCAFPAPPRLPRANESLPAAALAWLLRRNEAGTWLRADPGDRAKILARRARAARIAADPEVRALPRLTLAGRPGLVAAIRAEARPTLRWLTPRIGEPYDMRPVAPPRLPPAELARRLVAHLDSALTPEAARLVARAAGE